MGVMKNYRGEEIPPAVPVEDYNKKLNVLLAQVHNKTIHPFKAFMTFYDIIDSVCSYLKDYFSCIRGCSHCCYIKVDISKLEAELIKHTILSFTDSLKMNIINRIEPFVKDWSRFRQFNRSDDTRRYFQQQIPCAFLDDNRCMIYNVRPHTCRLYWVTTDPEECKKLKNPMLWENKYIRESSMGMIVNLNIYTYGFFELKPMQEYLQELL
jgi:Fe-S-cluster containining protein